MCSERGSEQRRRSAEEEGAGRRPARVKTACLSHRKRVRVQGRETSAPMGARPPVYLQDLQKQLCGSEPCSELRTSRSAGSERQEHQRGNSNGHNGLGAAWIRHICWDEAIEYMNIHVADTFDAHRGHEGEQLPSHHHNTLSECSPACVRVKRPYDVMYFATRSGPFPPSRDRDSVKPATHKKSAQEGSPTA